MAEQPSVSPEPAQTPGLRYRVLVSIFIAWHLIAFAAWLGPSDWLFRNRVVEVVRPYMLAIGLWQSWNMFAPSPFRENFHLEATVTYRNGSRSRGTFPRMEQLGYVERYQKERYRKYVEQLTGPRGGPALASAARWIVRQSPIDPANPPVQVVLTRVRTLIQPPGTMPAVLGPRRALARDVITYAIQPEDLR